jgi:hypothetical protein
MQAFRLEPRTETGIVNFRLVLPESRIETAVNLKMIQEQLDDRHIFGEIAPDIVCAHMKSGDFEALALRFDDHTYLTFIAG